MEEGDEEEKEEERGVRSWRRRSGGPEKEPEGTRNGEKQNQPFSSPFNSIVCSRVTRRRMGSDWHRLVQPFCRSAVQPFSRSAIEPSPPRRGSVEPALFVSLPLPLSSGPLSALRYHSPLSRLPHNYHGQRQRHRDEAPRVHRPRNELGHEHGERASRCSSWCCGQEADA